MSEEGNEKDTSAEAATAAVELTKAQKCRIERNRAKALNLRQAKLIAHPYSKEGAGKEGNDASTSDTSSIIKVQGTRYVDSGGGFLVEQPLLSQPSSADQQSKEPVAPLPPGESVPLPITYEECTECGDPYADSYLFNNFGLSVCDKCRDPDGKHSLITRTEAKAEYLLKDCDFDNREPILRYISRKNPHNARWGEMKLYLHMQVEERAMEVWGTEEEIVRQHELRDEKREVGKIKKYNKKMKHLRMDVRSSMFTKKTFEAHVHEFGEDTYNEEEDNYTHSCLTCPYSETYEKM